MAAQLSLARCSGRVISSRQVVAPRRLSAALVQHTRRPVVARSVVEVEAANSAKHEKKHKKEKDEEEEEWDGHEDDGLNPQQVESLLSVLCEETDIAEVELKMGGFKMRVRRSLKGGAAHAAPAPAAAPAAAAPAPAPAPAAAAAPAPAAVSASIETADEDEGLLDVTANKVGILRRGRYMKGKQVGKGEMVKVGDQVKKGQTLAFIEQLGTHWPLEAPQAGEIVEFLVSEGEPVEYKQPVVVISPFFGGVPGYV